MEPRFKECPKCKDTDIEILDDSWICWGCDWEEPINQEERDAQSTGK